MKQDDIFSRERGAEDGGSPSPWWAVVPSAMWLVGVVLLGAILTAVVWAFTGTVTQSVEITGIVFPQHGIESVKSRQGGEITSLLVKVGEQVEAGDLIAIIPSTQTLEEIETARSEGAGRQALELLYRQYQMESMVYTPISGRVVELAECGAHISAGDTVAGITSADPYSNDAEIRAYVPAGKAQSISKGMEVRIRPQYTSRGQQGYFPGLVSAISDYPVTEADIMQDLGRFYSGTELSQDENIVEVRVTLLLGSDTEQTGWNEAEEEGLTIDVSTLCSMEVIIGEMTPWEWLLR